MAWLTVWWIWIGVAFFLGIVEILLPSFFFLGFSLGALVIAGLTGLAPSLVADLAPEALLTLFAGLSLAVWLLLRFVFRRQSSGSKIFTKDIND
jgi:membrane protein implicated in regulation of membrane protease activity